MTKWELKTLKNILIKMLKEDKIKVGTKQKVVNLLGDLVSMNEKAL